MTVRRWGIAVRALLRDRRGRFLILQRTANSGWAPGAWEIPGGKLDAGETPDEGLRRELEEETGLTVTLDGFEGALPFEMPKVHVVTLVFRARVKSGRFRLSDEHDAFRWVSRSEMARADLSPQVAPFVQTFIRKS